MLENLNFRCELLLYDRTGGQLYRCRVCGRQLNVAARLAEPQLLSREEVKCNRQH